MRFRLTHLLFLVASLYAAPDVQAQERDWSNEEYARQRIHEIAESLAAGQRTVAAYDSLIVLHARAYEIDPDWLRAIMMVESARLPEEVGQRAAPTGIDAGMWVGLDGATAESFADPSENIRLAALLLRRIADRLPEDNSSLRVVASLYDNIETNAVTPYGVTVERAYDLRGWERKEAQE